MQKMLISCCDSDKTAASRLVEYCLLNLNTALALTHLHSSLQQSL